MTTGHLLPWNNMTDTSPTTPVYTDNTSSAGNHTTEHDPQMSKFAMGVYFSMRLVFSSFAIFGNMLIIMAVIRFTQLRNTTSFFICSLALADLLGGSLTPFSIAHETLSDQPIFVPLCLIDKSLTAISLCTNILSIMWISIDRYIYIAHGLRYYTIVTKTKTFIVIGLNWTLSVAQITAMFVLSSHLKIGMTCRFSIFLHGVAYYKILLPQLTLYTWITIGFNISIGWIAYKQGRAIAALNHPYDTYEAAMNRQQKRITKMMVMVLGTYVMCYWPQMFVSSMLRYNPKTMLWLHMEQTTALIYWANTWLNPLIYAWRSEPFRVAFRRLLRLSPTNVVTPNVPLVSHIVPPVNPTVPPVNSIVPPVNAIVPQVNPTVSQVNPTVPPVTPQYPWSTL